jgi:hypothetical protein
MYSPKIREDLIPYLYKLAHFLNVPMTKTVNSILEEVVDRLRDKGYFALFHELDQEKEAGRRLDDYFKEVNSHDCIKGASHHKGSGRCRPPSAQTS